MIFRLGELFCGPGGLAYGTLNAKAMMVNLQYSMHGQMILMQIHVQLT